LKEKVKHHAQRKRLYPIRNKNPQSGKQKIARKTRGGTPLRGKPNRRPETTPEFSNGVYTNRAFGSDCHYRIIDGDIDAGAATGEETSADGNLPGESAPMDTYLVDDHHR